MRDNAIIILVFCVFASIIIFGGHFAISMTGEIKPVQVENNAPGLLGIIQFCWNGIQFFFMFLAFGVSAGSGTMASIITWIFLLIGLLLVWILIKWIRGTSSGV